MDSPTSSSSADDIQSNLLLLNASDRERIAICHQSFHTRAYVGECLGAIFRWTPADSPSDELDLSTVPLPSFESVPVEWQQCSSGALVLQIHENNSLPQDPLKACLLCVHPEEPFANFRLYFFKEVFQRSEDFILFQVTRQSQLRPENRQLIRDCIATSSSMVFALHVPSPSALEHLLKALVDYQERYRIIENRDPMEWERMLEQQNKQKRQKVKLPKTAISHPNSFRRLVHVNPWKKSA